MSNSLTPKYSDLNGFLYKHKRPKNSNQAISHTSYGNPAKNIYPGSYCIHEQNDLNKFLRIYIKHVFENNQPCHIIERHLEKESKIVIDLDFRHSGNVGRQYTKEQILEFIKLVQQEIVNMMENKIEKDKLVVYVTEKKESRYEESKGWTKDGIHIMFPNIVTDFMFQYVLRNRIIKKPEIKTLFQNIGCINPIYDVYDKSVIQSNGWIMYGSSKPDAEPYICTYIVDKNGNDRPCKRSAKDLVTICSIRINRDKDRLLPSDEEGNEELNNIFKKIEREFNQLPDVHKDKKRTKNAKMKKRTPGKKHQLEDDSEFERVKALVKMLSKERAIRYETWIKVGWCLHNIDNRLLSDWIAFSKQAAEQFEEGVCEKEWEYMKDDGLNIGTLHRWAKQDNPKMYRIFKQKYLTSAINQSLTGLPNDVARVVYLKYKNQYICVNLKKKGWYKYKGHRWQPDNDAVSLRQKLSGEVVGLYQDYCSKMYAEAGKQGIEDSEKELILEKVKKAEKVIALLKKTSFKKNIMEECMEFFFQENFEEKLDSNENLLGFENGIYDLKQGEFREGEPEDMLTFTTGIEYVKYDEDEPILKEIDEFLEQILPYSKVRAYMLTCLSMFLCGKNIEKFHIWTGRGGNGKSKLIDLYRKSIGDYACTLPVAIITQTRGRGESANPSIAATKGKRFAILQEPEPGVCLNNGLMKEYTGGDIIKARSLFSNFEEFKPQFKMVLVCNDMPEVNASDRGTWRRIRVCDFPSKFTEDPDPDNPLEFKIDYNLDEKLEIWKEAFMYKLLQIYEDYKKNGITEPKEVTTATNEYKCDTDNFTQYIDEHYELSKEYKGTKMLISDIYKHYKVWYESMKTGKPPKSSQLKTAMEAKFGKYKGGFKGLIRKISKEDEDEPSFESEEEEI